MRPDFEARSPTIKCESPAKAGHIIPDLILSGWSSSQMGNGMDEKYSVHQITQITKSIPAANYRKFPHTHSLHSGLSVPISPARQCGSRRGLSVLLCWAQEGRGSRGDALIRAGRTRFWVAAHEVSCNGVASTGGDVAEDDRYDPAVRLSMILEALLDVRRSSSA